MLAKIVKEFYLRRTSMVAAMLLTVLFGGAVLAVSLRGSLKTNESAKEAATANVIPAVQSNAVRAGYLNAKLSIQPEANRLRRRLGNRFLSQGNTISTLVGTLTVGTQSQPVRIVRGYDENGETVMIERTGSAEVLNWNDNTGALVNGSRATGETRALIERLALDSGDQFVLAQLRGASYRTIARKARPAEAGSDDNYRGSLWDLVQISEPKRLADKAPLSASRQYYINTSTGLIDRILSQENRQTITAELSGWTQVSGEAFATKIVWQQGAQKLMELVINNATVGNRQ